MKVRLGGSQGPKDSILRRDIEVLPGLFERIRGGCNTLFPDHYSSLGICRRGSGYARSSRFDFLLLLTR